MEGGGGVADRPASNILTIAFRSQIETHQRVVEQNMGSLRGDECGRLLSAYETALAARIEAHRSKSAGDLVRLDSWRLNALSKAVRTRKSPFMTKDELETLMECKL